MELNTFKEDIINGKVIFNDLKKEELEEFFTEFDKLEDNDKEFLLVEIIDYEHESNLLEKNYLTLFERDGIAEILENSL